MSAIVDIMGMPIKRMHDINITTIPLNPYDIIAENRWQVGTYQLFSQVIGMSSEEMEQQISPRAFSFYSFSYSTFFIVYNNNFPIDKIYFNLAHEIGHIFYGHISPTIPLMCFPGENKLQRDALANDFARFILKIK